MRIKRLLLGGKVLELPHPFVEEAEWLVQKNHSLVLESIDRLERNEVSRLCAEMEDTPEVDSEIAYAKSMADDLRNAANQLALVSLVTRLQHWINDLVRELPNASRDTGLVPNLRTLNRVLGESLVKVDYFADLVTLRDSVIHADSQVEWSYNGKLRRVPDRYIDINSGQVNLSEWHLKEAIEISIKQVNWYDKRLDEWVASRR
jgi:hypothetical protein